ncbi:hypothetical protein VKT23_013015 [Stygiomarasmius scandens]|uniref:Uncharacterized protein n=1 Tax=Marasmiellus scandens TaxID=2682957 RepID=A0ABR1J8Y3_9AGAR
MSMFQAVRRIVLKKPFGVFSQTAEFVRDLSVKSFRDSTVYRNKPKKIQEAFLAVDDFAEDAGLNDAGAEVAVFEGPEHQSPSDNTVHYTVEFRDNKNKVIYWYRKSDGTFWDRLHMPARVPANQEIWDSFTKKYYIKITEEEFKKKKLITTKVE